MIDHEDYKVIADLTDHIADASAHHARYSDAEARAAINDIFGSDGKADADIDLDGHDLIPRHILLQDNTFLGHSAIHGRLIHSLTNGFSFFGTNTGFGVLAPLARVDIRGILSDTPGKSTLVIGYDNPYWSFRLASTPLASLIIDRYFAGAYSKVFEITRSTGDVDISLHNASTLGLKLGGTLVSVSAAEINFLEGVSYGDDDSGGVGFKLLRVPN